VGTIFEWRTQVIFRHTPKLTKQELKLLRLALVDEFGESTKLKVTAEAQTETTIIVKATLDDSSGYQAVGAMWRRIDPVLTRCIGTYSPVNHGAEPKNGDWGPWQRQHGQA
jgi:hypothetical protein